MIFRKNIIYVVIVLVIFGFCNVAHAEDTYTCSAQNVKKLYCSILNDSLREQYGCTITSTSNGCSGTCTKLTREVIESYGSYLNMNINDCTKNGTNTSNTTTTNQTQEQEEEPTQNQTQEPEQETEITPQASATSTDSSNNNTQNVLVNPKTGSAMIIVVFVIAIVSLGYTLYYYREVASANQVDSSDSDNSK